MFLQEEVVLEAIFPTITIAFIIFLIAFVFLGLGLIFTGKSKIQRGGCSKIPGKGDGSCTPSACSLCGRGEKEEKAADEKKDDKENNHTENR